MPMGESRILKRRDADGVVYQCNTCFLQLNGNRGPIWPLSRAAWFWSSHMVEGGLVHPQTGWMEERGCSLPWWGKEMQPGPHPAAWKEGRVAWLWSGCGGRFMVQLWPTTLDLEFFAVERVAVLAATALACCQTCQTMGNPEGQIPRLNGPHLACKLEV